MVCSALVASGLVNFLNGPEHILEHCGEFDGSSSPAPPTALIGMELTGDSPLRRTQSMSHVSTRAKSLSVSSASSATAANGGGPASPVVPTPVPAEVGFPPFDASASCYYRFLVRLLVYVVYAIALSLTLWLAACRKMNLHARGIFHARGSLCHAMLCACQLRFETPRRS